MGTMTLCHTTQAIENDKSFQLKIFMHPRSPLHRTSWREVLPTRAIMKLTNSIGKRTLPNRRILPRVIYYACSL
jgi:hypothetical protein